MIQVAIGIVSFVGVLKIVFIFGDYLSFNQNYYAKEQIKMPFSMLKHIISLQSDMVDFTESYVYLCEYGKSIGSFKPPLLKKVSIKLSFIDYIKYQIFLQKLNSARSKQKADDIIQKIISAKEIELGLNTDKYLKELEEKYQYTK